MPTLPSMPVTSHASSTLNFEKLQKRLADFDRSVATAYCSEAQKIPKAVLTKVKINKVVNDPGNNVGTRAYYAVPATGYYHVDGQVVLELNEKALAIAYVLVGGLEKLEGQRMVAPAATNYAVSVSGVIHCTMGEAIELAVYQGGNEVPLVFGTEVQNRLSVVRVA